MSFTKNTAVAILLGLAATPAVAFEASIQVNPITLLPSEQGDLTVILNNAAASGISDVAFDLAMPSGVSLNENSPVVSTCGGVWDLSGGTFSVEDADIPAIHERGGFCTITAKFTANVRGQYAFEMAAGDVTGTINETPASSINAALGSLTIGGRDVVPVVTWAPTTLFEGADPAVLSIRLPNNNNFELTGSFALSQAQIRGSYRNLEFGIPRVTNCGLDAGINYSMTDGLIATNLSLGPNSTTTSTNCVISFSAINAPTENDYRVISKVFSLPANALVTDQGITNAISNNTTLTERGGINLAYETAIKPYNGIDDASFKLNVTSRLQSPSNGVFSVSMPNDALAISASFTGSRCDLAGSTAIVSGDGSRIDVSMAMMEPVGNVDAVCSLVYTAKATTSGNKTINVNTPNAPIFTTPDGDEYVTNTPTATMTYAVGNIVASLTSSNISGESGDVLPGNDFLLNLSINNLSGGDVTNIKAPIVLSTNTNMIAEFRGVESNSCGFVVNNTPSSDPNVSDIVNLSLGNVPMGEVCSIVLRAQIAASAYQTGNNSNIQSSIRSNTLRYSVNGGAERGHSGNVNRNTRIIPRISSVIALSNPVVNASGISNLTWTLNHNGGAADYSAMIRDANIVASGDSTFEEYISGTCPANIYTISADKKSVSISDFTMASDYTCNAVFSLKAGSTAFGTTEVAVGRSVTGGFFANSFSPALGMTPEEPLNEIYLDRESTVTQNWTAHNVGVSTGFSPSNIPAGGDSRVSISILNNQMTPIALSDVGISSIMPSGHLKISNSLPVSYTNCGSLGGITTNAPTGGTTFSASGMSIAANATCIIGFNVTSMVGGSHINEIAVGGVTSRQGVTNSMSAASTLLVDRGVAVSKSFAKTHLYSGEETEMTVTLQNSDINPLVSLNRTFLVDNFPADLSPVSLVSNSCGGTYSQTANQITLGNSILMADSSCQMVVRVRLSETVQGGDEIVNTINPTDVSFLTVDGEVLNARVPASASIHVIQDAIITYDLNKPWAFLDWDSDTMPRVTLRMRNPNPVDMTITGLVMQANTASMPLEGYASCLHSSVGGTNSVTYTSVTIPGGATCSFTHNLNMTAMTHGGPITIGEAETSSGNFVFAGDVMTFLPNTLPKVLVAYSEDEIEMTDRVGLRMEILPHTDGPEYLVQSSGLGANFLTQVNGLTANYNISAQTLGANGILIMEGDGLPTSYGTQEAKISSINIRKGDGTWSLYTITDGSEKDTLNVIQPDVEYDFMASGALTGEFEATYISTILNPNSFPFATAASGILPTAENGLSDALVFEDESGNTEVRVASNGTVQVKGIMTVTPAEYLAGEKVVDILALGYPEINGIVQYAMPWQETQTVRIDLNRAPVVQGGVIPVSRTGVNLTYGILANATDVNNDIDPESITILLGSMSEYGTFYTNADYTVSTADSPGTISINIANGATDLPDTILFKVKDKKGLESNVGTITVNYQLSPLAVNDALSVMPSDLTQGIDVLGNDIVRSSVATIDASSALFMNGQSTLNVAGEGIWSFVGGKLYFEREANFNGSPAPVSYTVADSLSLRSQPAIVTLTVEALQAADDSSLLNRPYEPFEMDVIDNDPSKAHLDLESILFANGQTSMTISGEGTWQVIGGGKIRFTPVAAFHGKTDLTPVAYTVADSSGVRTPAANVSASYAYLPPVGSPDVIRIEDPTVNTVFGVLSNDLRRVVTLGNGETMEIGINPQSVMIGHKMGDGSFQFGTGLLYPTSIFINLRSPINFDNQFTVIMRANATELFAGVVYYIYQDEFGVVSDPVEIRFDYADIPSPVLQDHLVELHNYVGTTFSVTATPGLAGLTIDYTSTSFEDGSKRKVVSGEGEWEINDRSIVFTPEAGLQRNPTPQTVTVKDQLGTISNSATMTIIYNVVYPVAVADSMLAAETTLPASLDVLANDNIGGTELDRSSVLFDNGTTTKTVAGQGVWTVSNIGIVTFTPAQGFTLSPTPVTYTVADIYGRRSEPVSVNMTYTPRPPVALNDSNDNGNFAIGTVGSIRVITNDYDPDGSVSTGSIMFDNGAKTKVVPGEGVWSSDLAGFVNFTPEEGFRSSPTPVTYTIADNNGNRSDPATITMKYDVIVPVALADLIEDVVTNGPASLNVVQNDNLGGTAINAASVLFDNDTATKSVAGEGVWTVDALGIVTFTPEQGFTASPAPVTYTVADIYGVRSEPVSITVIYAVQRPDAANDANIGLAAVGAAATVNVVTNDSDPDGRIDIASVLFDNGAATKTVAGEGVWTVDALGVVTFTPEHGFRTSPTAVTYTVSDNDGNRSDPATITMNYEVLVPVALADDISGVVTNGPASLNVVSNDNIGGTAINAASVLFDNGTATKVVAGKGVWSVDALGVVTFTPEQGFTASPAPVTYTVADIYGVRSEPVSITVIYAVQRPDAANDANIGLATVGAAATVNVVTNDSDPDGRIDIGSVLLDNGTTTKTVSGEGVWSVDALGVVTFTPEQGFRTSPTAVTYTVADNDGNRSNPATITMNYEVLVPVALADLIEDVVTNGPASLNVVLNDNVGGTAINAASVFFDNGAATKTVTGEGVWTVDTLGIVTFTPEQGFTASPAPVTYTVADIYGVRSEPVAITVIYAVQRPDAANDANTGLATVETAASVNVVTNDSDPDGRIDIASVLFDNGAATKTVAGEGVWSVDALGVVTFTPEQSFRTSPTAVTYTVSDNDGNRSDPATITMNYEVLVPVALADDISGVVTNGPASLNVVSNDNIGGTAINAASVLFDNGTATKVVAGAGVWSVDAMGVVTFTPEQGFTASPAPVTYTVADIYGVRSEPVTITVAYAVQPPFADNDIVTSPAAGPISIAVLGNDNDSDGELDHASILLTGGQTQIITSGEGVWNIIGDEIQFMPEPNFVGTASVTYTVADNDGNRSNVATVAITITIPMNTAPSANRDTHVAGDPNTTVIIDVLANDTDAENDALTISLVGGDVNGQIVVSGEGLWSIENGKVVFTPEAGFYGNPASVSYLVTDAQGGVSSPAMINLSYTANSDMDINVSVGNMGDLNGNDVMDPGDRPVFIFKVTNTGNVPLTDVTVTSPDLNGMICAPVTLLPGQSMIVSCTNASRLITEADVVNGSISITAQSNGNYGTVTVAASMAMSVQVVPTPFVGSPDVTIAKRAVTSDVYLGQTMVWEITVTSREEKRDAVVNVTDILPAGLQFAGEGARINDAAATAQVSGRNVTFSNVTIAAGASLRITLPTVVQATSGALINEAIVIDAETGEVIARTSAQAEVVPEPAFMCSDVMGRVFEDRNRNGIMDQGERGIGAARLVTQSGIVVITDEHGRFSLPCEAAPSAIGSNGQIKVDEASLPDGYEISTRNPLVYRMTAGKSVMLSFGANETGAERVVTVPVTIDARAFSDNQPSEELVAALRQAMGSAAQGTRFTITYDMGNGENAETASERLRALHSALGRSVRGHTVELLRLAR